MNARQLVSECSRIACSMTPYIDGELDPGHAVDVEAHIGGCQPCAERLALMVATRSSLKRAVATPSCPSALRSRMSEIVSSLAKEPPASSPSFPRASATSTGTTADFLGFSGTEDPLLAAQAQAANPKLIRLRYAVALAAAAGVALAFGASRNREASSTLAAVSDPVAPHQEASVARFDTLLDELVALHAKPLPPETTNPEELPRFDPFVGVPVRRPVFKPFGASFNGARVVPTIADRRAALLQYTVSGHRVTVYVFDPRAVPLRPLRLHARVMHQIPNNDKAGEPVVRSFPVYSGQLRGYSVAATESRRGVGYAIATDLSDDESANMVMAAAMQ